MRGGRTISSVPMGSRASAASAASERLRWTDVLASISDGVVVLDATGILTDLNPAAEQ
jgi:PAS domain-containing protein